MTQRQGISQKVAVGDPRDGTAALKINDDGSINTNSGSGTGISSTEGEGNLVDLSGASVTDGSITLNANGEFAVVDTLGFENASFTVSGFGTATLQVQWSNLPTTGFVAGLIVTVGTTTTATDITANGQYTAPAGGRYMKIIVTAYTSGALVVTPTLYAGGGSGVASGGGGGGGGAVTIADGADVAQGDRGDAAWAGTGDSTVVAALKALVLTSQSTDPINTYPLPETPVSGFTAAMTGLTEAAVTGVGAGGVGVHNYITQITITNTDADTGTLVQLQDGAGGAAFYPMPAPAAVNGVGVAGAVLNFSTPLKQPTADTALYAINSTTGASVIVAVSGFQK